jgi:hypothetical protein
MRGLTVENSVYCYPSGQDGWFAPRLYFAADAKAFAKLLWGTGAFRRVAVVNKRDQVTWERGDKKEGDEA